MNRIINNKKLKLFVGITIITVALLITFFTLLFWNSSYSSNEVKITASLVDKIRETQKQGGILKLNREELNQVIDMYFKKGKSFSGITVKAIDGDIANNNLVIYMPITYKGFNMLLSSEGSISYEKDKIQYKPVYFKVGKINLPKGLVLNKLKNNLKGNITVKDSSIAVDKNIIPLKIKSIQTKDNQVLIEIEKMAALEESLKYIQNNIKGANSSNAANNSSNDATNSVEGNPTERGKDNTKVSNENKDTSEMDEALDRINSGLNSAMGSVSTSKQKEVISKMIAASNNMKGNPNANPYSAAGEVKSAYKVLSAQEKAELKSALFSNVNGNDISIINKMLGN